VQAISFSSEGAVPVDPWVGIMANYKDDAQFGGFIRKLLQTEDFLALK
jgi:hypothetical protein